MEIREFLLASGFMGAVYVLLQQLLLWWVKRRAEKKDAAGKSQEQRLKDVELKLDNVIAGQMVTLQDRVKWLGASYLEKGCISLENRRDLVAMHKAYQQNGGNGHLDALMDQVMKLPLGSK